MALNKTQLVAIIAVVGVFLTASILFSGHTLAVATAFNDELGVMEFTYSNGPVPYAIALSGNKVGEPITITISNLYTVLQAYNRGGGTYFATPGNGSSAPVCVQDIRIDIYKVGSGATTDSTVGFAMLKLDASKLKNATLTAKFVPKYEGTYYATYEADMLYKKVGGVYVCRISGFKERSSRITIGSNTSNGTSPICGDWLTIHITNGVHKTRRCGGNTYQTTVCDDGYIATSLLGNYPATDASSLKSVNGFDTCSITPTSKSPTLPNGTTITPGNTDTSPPSQTDSSPNYPTPTGGVTLGGVTIDQGWVLPLIVLGIGAVLLIRRRL